MLGQRQLTDFDTFEITGVEDVMFVPIPVGIASARNNLYRRDTACARQSSLDTEPPLRRTYNEERKIWAYETIGRSIDQKDYLCDLCKTKFRNKSSIILHLKSHKEVNSITVNRDGKVHFKCDVCGRLYLWKTSLMNHYKTHYDEKTLACDVCEKAFWIKSTLSNHRKMHAVSKPFKCDVCPKGFLRKQTLIKHTTTHTGQKPFTCNVCERTFIYKTSLFNHTKNVHTKNDVFRTRDYF